MGDIRETLRVRDPFLYTCIDRFCSTQGLNFRLYCDLAVYCLDKGMPNDAITPMMDKVIWQAGARFDDVIRYMADQWQKPPILEQILKN